MNKKKNNKEKLSPGQAKISPRLFFHQRHKPKTLQDRNSEQCVPKIAISKSESMLYWSNESICCLVTKYYTITIIIMIITKNNLYIAVIVDQRVYAHILWWCAHASRWCYSCLPLLYYVGRGGGTIWSLKIDWLSQKSQSALELYSLEHNNNINSNNNNTPFADQLGAKDIHFRKV